jgi:hypothetical protein
MDQVLGHHEITIFQIDVLGPVWPMLFYFENALDRLRLLFFLNTVGSLAANYSYRLLFAGTLCGMFSILI